MTNIRSNAHHAKRLSTLTGVLLVAAAMQAPLAQARESPVRGSSEGWFVRSWGAFSSLSDTSGSITDVAFAPDGDAVDVSTSGGFAAGAGIGYRYGSRLGVELAWEYRSNDSETSFESGTSFNEGNYASNTFFLNGYWYLPSRGRFEPYLGAGLAWIQEVDIDLEGNGPEQSFSGDGDVGLQLFGGAQYRLSPQWSLHGELRYGAVSGIDLSNESGPGSISGFDYEPLSVQLGINFEF